jgi:hypothetical protein
MYGQVTLDRSGDTWVGTFPGLGQVRVHADGSYDITCDDVAGGDTAPEDTPEAATDSTSARYDALRHGWARPLSLVRRGFELLSGAVLAPPSAPVSPESVSASPSGAVPFPPALVVTGRPHDVAIVVATLAARGWSVLGDRFVPVNWSDEHGTFVAYPTDAPVLVGERRARKAGFDGTPVRTDSDVVAIDVARSAGPHLIAGVADARNWRHGDSALTELSGFRRFEHVGLLTSPGVLAGDEAMEPSALMARQMRLAQLPVAELAIAATTVDADIDGLVAWWHRSRPGAEGEMSS